MWRTLFFSSTTAVRQWSGGTSGPIRIVSECFSIYRNTIRSVLCSRESCPPMALMRKYDVQATYRGEKCSAPTRMRILPGFTICRLGIEMPKTAPCSGGTLDRWVIRWGRVRSTDHKKRRRKRSDSQNLLSQWCACATGRQNDTSCVR